MSMNTIAKSFGNWSCSIIFHGYVKWPGDISNPQGSIPDFSITLNQHLLISLVTLVDSQIIVLNPYNFGCLMSLFCVLFCPFQPAFQRPPVASEGVATFRGLDELGAGVLLELVQLLPGTDSQAAQGIEILPKFHQNSKRSDLGWFRFPCFIAMLLLFYKKRRVFWCWFNNSVWIGFTGLGPWTEGMHFFMAIYKASRTSIMNHSFI